MIADRHNVEIPAEYRDRMAARRSDIPTADRLLAALKVENARLARELADAAATTARLRTQLAAAQGRLEPVQDYEPHDAPPANGRPQHGAVAAPARAPKRIRRGWLLDALRGREPMSCEDIMAATKRTRGAVHVATSTLRDRLVVTGNVRDRRFALKPDA